MEHLLRDVKDTTISTLANEVFLFSPHSFFSLFAEATSCVNFRIKFFDYGCLSLNKNILKKKICLLFCSGFWKTHSFKGFGCATTRDTWLPWSCYWWEASFKSWDTLSFTGIVCYCTLLFSPWYCYLPALLFYFSWRLAYLSSHIWCHQFFQKIIFFQ